jgi:hypothetical protein
MVVTSGGVSAAGNFQVDAGGTTVRGGLVTESGVEVTAGGVHIRDGAISINGAGTDQLVTIRAQSSIELALTQYEADSDAVSFHGNYTGSSSGYLDVVVDHVGSPADLNVDSFTWRKCEVVVSGSESHYECSAFVEGVLITPGTPQLLTQGVFVTFESGSGHSEAHGWVVELTAIGPLGVAGSAGDDSLVIGQDGSMDATRSLDVEAGMSISGGLVGADGASVSGGVISEGVLSVEANGIRVETGQMHVARGGLHSHAGILVHDIGYAAIGGATMLGGLSAARGLSVIDSDLRVSGRVKVHRYDCNSSHCAQSVVGGGMIVAGGVEVHAGARLHDLAANDGVAVVAGGVSVNGSVSIVAEPQASRVNTFLLDGQALQGLDASPTVFARDIYGSGRTVVSGTGAVVSSGGASFADWTVVATGAMHVLGDGISVARGGANVANGATLDSGILWLRDGGAKVRGGATLSGGATVKNEGLTISSGGIDVQDGGCRIAGGLAISCGGVTVVSGHVNANGGLEIFSGGTQVGESMRVTSGGMQVGLGVSVQAGGALTHGPVSVHDLGVGIFGVSTFRAGLGVRGGVLIGDVGIQIADGVAVSNGRVVLGSDNDFNQMVARGQSSIGPVVSQSNPSDVVFEGPYTGSASPARIEVQIDSSAGAGPTDTFAWLKCTTVDGGEGVLIILCALFVIDQIDELTSVYAAGPRCNVASVRAHRGVSDRRTNNCRTQRQTSATNADRRCTCNVCVYHGPSSRRKLVSDSFCSKCTSIA